MEPGTIMAAVGGASGALGGIGNIFGSLLSYSQQKKLQRHQAQVNYEYAEKAARNQPTWNRAGLEGAGYNPMLAVQNATSGANSNWASGGSADMPDIAGGISSGIANAQSFQRLENETNTAKSQVETNEATAENQRAEAANKRVQNPYIGKQLEAEIGKTNAEITKLNSDTEYNHSLMDNMKQRLALDQYLGELGIHSNLLGVRYSADKSYNASTYHANKLKEIADEHSPSGSSESFKNYLEGISSGVRSVGSLLPWTETHYDSKGNSSVKVHKKGRKK